MFMYYITVVTAKVSKPHFIVGVERTAEKKQQHDNNPTVPNTNRCRGGCPQIANGNMRFEMTGKKGTASVDDHVMKRKRNDNNGSNGNNFFEKKELFATNKRQKQPPNNSQKTIVSSLSLETAYYNRSTRMNMDKLKLDKDDYKFVGLIGSNEEYSDVDKAITNIFAMDENGKSNVDKKCHYQLGISYRDVVKKTLPDVGRALQCSAEWKNDDHPVYNRAPEKAKIRDRKMRLDICSMFAWNIAHGVTENTNSTKPMEVNSKKAGKCKLIEWKGTPRGANENKIDCLFECLIVPSMKLLARHFDTHEYIAKFIQRGHKKNGGTLYVQNMYKWRKDILEDAKLGSWSFNHVFGDSFEVDPMKKKGYAISGIRNDFLPAQEKFTWTTGVMKNVLDKKYGLKHGLHMTAEEIESLPESLWSDNGKEKKKPTKKARTNTLGCGKH